jgi:hypothetical protein
MLTTNHSRPGPSSAPMSHTPSRIAAAANPPWLMILIGPIRHSRHEFAIHSATRRMAIQIACMRTTMAKATTPASTSAIECIPVVTQLTPTSAAHVHHAFIFARPPSPNAEAAISAQTI